MHLKDVLIFSTATDAFHKTNTALGIVVQKCCGNLPILCAMYHSNLSKASVIQGKIFACY